MEDAQVIKRTTAVAAMAIAAAGGALAQAARDNINIVGSSTVYPFTTVVAEQFGRATTFKTPKVEQNGTGGGFKLFCGGVGIQHPDITNASRAIKASEIGQCRANGVEEIVEVKIGYDGIVVANSKSAPRLDLALRDIYLALARDVPAPDGSHKLVRNPYRTWKEINPALPAVDIEVLGPPPTSGTRDAFVELAMEGGCQSIDWIAALKDSDEDRFKSACHTLREDHAYVEAGENDNLIVKKIESNPAALGVFGFSFLDQNADVLQGSLVDGVEPSFEAIAAGQYPVSRSLFIYAKKAHIGRVPGMKEFLAEYTSERAWGPDGYLADKGLIPLPDAEREAMHARVASLQAMRVAQQ
jgi:phosphate transport system substrate-binding protein